MLFFHELMMSIGRDYVQPLEDSLRTREPKAAKEKPKRIDVHRIHKTNLRTMKQR